ncbi:hypothetical protein F383_31349 [Gossypium arboreum]|uniref:Uncharacterized protein n=1 Tax=Gossypium arboreum TaxID=29729 RepID=A0A0B0PEX3_GOSAR|nr:hypothetical protein F383_31349 [Gossypium arboreum]
MNLNLIHKHRFNM